MSIDADTTSRLAQTISEVLVRRQAAADEAENALWVQQHTDPVVLLALHVQRFTDRLGGADARPVKAALYESALDEDVDALVEALDELIELADRADRREANDAAGVIYKPIPMLRVRSGNALLAAKKPALDPAAPRMRRATPAVVAAKRRKSG